VTDEQALCERIDVPQSPPEEAVTLWLVETAGAAPGQEAFDRLWDEDRRMTMEQSPALARQMGTQGVP
jgi:hypothetical protein